MRCPEVIHELAAPTADCDARALAAHLADCEPCALWAKRDAEIKLLWGATRPDPPSSATWSAIWFRVSESLERADSAGLATTGFRDRGVPSRSRKFARFGMVVLAQAAAVLLMVGVMWRPVPPANHVPRAVLAHSTHLEPTTGVQDNFVEIDEGRVVLIRVEASSQDVVQIASAPIEGGVDDWYVLFNEVESLATSPVVAMQE